MALENQPVFQAPSLPKMGKGSSPLVKNAGITSSIFSKPKLKASKMSFVKSKKIESPVEKLKKENTTEIQGTGSVATALVETNSILVEIQKQLALDFANRIAERKGNLIAAKKKVRKKKLTEKEEFVERGKGLSSTIKNFGVKVLAPVKGIFDKLLDFLALVATGLVLNTAWEWLSKEENRKKITDVLEFLGKNWKLIAGIIGGLVVGKAIYKLYRVINGLRKVAKFLRGPRSKPGLPGSKTPADCNPILNCLKNAAVVTAMASAVAPAVANILAGKGLPAGSGPIPSFNLTDFLNGLALLVAPFIRPLASPAAAAGEEQQIPARPFYGPGGDPLGSGKGQAIQRPELAETPEEATRRVTEEIEGQQGDYSSPLKSFTGREIPLTLAPILNELQAEYARTGKTASRLTPLGHLQVRATAPNRIGFLGGPDMTPQVSFNPKLTPESNKAAVAQAETLFTIANLPATLAPVLSARGAMSRSISSASQRGSLGAFRPPKNITGPSAPARTQTKSRGISYEELQRIMDQSGLRVGRSGSTSTSKQVSYGDAIRGEYDALLRRGYSESQANKELMKIFKQSDLDAVLSANRLSAGGLIPGVASMMDSIPALLAKGEFVINSMSTKLFKPFLFAINDNAGKMFAHFVQAIKQIRENVNIDQEISDTQNKQFKQFGKMVEEMDRRAREEKLREAIPITPTGGGILNQVKPTKRKTPTKIQTYSRGRGGPSTRPASSSPEGKVTTINMTKPAVNLAAQQTPEEPPMEPAESASPSITIRPFDSSNRYIMNNYEIYGIVV